MQLRELELACDGAFNTMSRLNWSTMNHVTGHSPFMNDITQATEQVAEFIKPLVEQKKYLKNFLDKASRSVLRPISENRLTTPSQRSFNAVHECPRQEPPTSRDWG